MMFEQHKIAFSGFSISYTRHAMHNAALNRAITMIVTPCALRTKPEATHVM